MSAQPSKSHGSKRPPAPIQMRRVAGPQRRALLARLDPNAKHLPLLHGDAGHLLVVQDGGVSVAELWIADQLVAGYVWPSGRPSAATLTLPTGTPIVFVKLADREAA